MKTISVHGLDEETEKLLKKRAKSEGKSVNKVVKEIIRRALGIIPDKKDHRKDFAHFLGVWSKRDENAFTEAIEDLETANPEDWK